MTPLVGVVGSANVDIVLSVNERPMAGETVLGTGYSEAPGGKGLNQAIAAARVAPTVFVGSVGRDSGGRLVEATLSSATVSTAHLSRDDLPTGRAYISLTPNGENSIIVIPLANTALTAAATVKALDAAQPSIVLTQLEVPPAVTDAVAAWCEVNERRFVLNPSPVRAISPSTLAVADPLVANQVEARDILGVTSSEDADLARALSHMCRSVVLTAGSRGAYVVNAGVLTHVEGEPVPVVDTTGAGDAFAGTLASQLALGHDLLLAAERANAEAARTIQLARADR